MKINPITATIIILGLALGSRGDCFCGTTSQQNRVFTFPADSSHLQSTLSAYVESLTKRFNAFSLKDPVQKIPLVLSDSRSLTFRHVAGHLEVDLLYCLNGLIYFQVQTRVTRFENLQRASISIALEEIIQPDLPLASSTPTFASKVIWTDDADFEGVLCRFFISFIDAITRRQLKFSVLDLLNPQTQKNKLDQRSTTCLPVFNRYFYTLPRTSVSKTLTQAITKKHRGRVLGRSQAQQALLDSLLNRELTRVSLRADLVHLEEKINENNDAIQRMAKAKQSKDLMSVEFQLISQYEEKHKAIKAVHDQILNQEFQKIEEFKQKAILNVNGDRFSDLRFAEQVTTELNQNTFFERFGPSDSNFHRPSSIKGDLEALVEDLVYRKVELENPEKFGRDLAEAGEAIRRQQTDSMGKYEYKPQSTKESARQEIKLTNKQLRNSARIPDFKKVAAVVADSENESLSSESDPSLELFRKETLQELTQSLREMEKPINGQLGQPAMLRNGILDLKPEYNGVPSITPMEEILKGFADEASFSIGSQIEETINDARAISRARVHGDLQPCDQAFNPEPLFVYDTYKAELPPSYVEVAPLAEITRQKRVNLAEEMKLKVVYDSKWQDFIDGINGGDFQGSVKHKINLMNTHLPQSDKKLQEMHDWLINVVETIANDAGLQKLAPRIQIYSDYSLHVQFKGMSREESMKKLYEVLRREEEAEMEVVVEMRDDNEAHYMIIPGGRLLLVQRKRSTEGQRELALMALGVVKKSDNPQ